MPATVAIINGRIKVGLNANELSKLGDIGTSKPIKTSRRDFAHVVSNKLNGGTTVSGTLLVADKVGIPIFATGGLYSNQIMNVKLALLSTIALWVIPP